MVKTTKVALKGKARAAIKKGTLKAMEKVKIKRVKRNIKKATTSEKILAGIGVGSTLLGGASAVMSKPEKTQFVRNDENQQSGKSRIKSALRRIFGVESAQAVSAVELAAAAKAEAQGNFDRVSEWTKSEWDLLAASTDPWNDEISASDPTKTNREVRQDALNAEYSTAQDALAAAEKAYNDAVAAAQSAAPPVVAPPITPPVTPPVVAPPVTAPFTPPVLLPPSAGTNITIIKTTTGELVIDWSVIQSRYGKNTADRIKSMVVDQGVSIYFMGAFDYLTGLIHFEYELPTGYTPNEDVWIYNLATEKAVWKGPSTAPFSPEEAVRRIKASGYLGNTTGTGASPASSFFPAPVNISAINLPNGKVNQPYSYQMGVSSGVPSDYIWNNVSGLWPSGLNLDSKTGKLTGSPIKAGTYEFTIASQKLGTSVAETKKYKLVVTAASGATPSTPGAPASPATPPATPASPVKTLNAGVFLGKNPLASSSAEQVFISNLSVYNEDDENMESKVKSGYTVEIGGQGLEVYDKFSVVVGNKEYEIKKFTKSQYAVQLTIPNLPEADGLEAKIKLISSRYPAFTGILGESFVYLASGESGTVSPMSGTGAGGFGGGAAAGTGGSGGIIETGEEEEEDEEEETTDLDEENEDEEAVDIDAEEETPAASSSSNVSSYTVKKGDTLWSLAQKFYGDGKMWRKILEANTRQLKSPTDLKAGMVLVIPNIAK